MASHQQTKRSLAGMINHYGLLEQFAMALFESSEALFAVVAAW